MLYALALTWLATISVAAVLIWAKDVQERRLSIASVGVLFLAGVTYTLFFWPDHAGTAFH